jgi:hypothetical protein
LQELLAARTHEEAHEYHRCFEVERGVSLVEVVIFLAQLVEEPNLEQLVYFLGVRIKMNGESRSFIPSVPVTYSSIVSSMFSPTE